MEYITIPHTDLKVSRLALGCMRLKEKNLAEAESLIKSALEAGINCFDHSDVYQKGECENLFGEILKRNPLLRKEMIIQTKCDIVPEYAGGQRYDTSKEYILNCVENALKRLQCEYLDILLLHRPDALCDPQELAETFEKLHQTGLVRYFGVSNHSVSKMELLRKFTNQPLVINQVQLSIVHSYLFDSGFFVNMSNEEAVDRDNGMLDYCQLHDITLQAWCPLQASWADGTFLDNPKFPRLNRVLQRIANEYGTSKSAIAVAWLLRHPANIQPVIGTTSEQHLEELCKAVSIKLTRQQWYDLYMAEGKRVP